MTAYWDSMTNEERDLAAAAFDALSVLDEIRTRAPEAHGERKQSVGFSALYAYVSNPGEPLSPALAAALREDAGLAADLKRLLTNDALYQAPSQAAASSGDSEQRQGPGFTLEIRPSQAEESQVYVIIRLTGPHERLGAIFVTYGDSGCLKESLPSATEGTFQLLFDSDAAIVQALRNPQSEVFLR